MPASPSRASARRARRSAWTDPPKDCAPSRRTLKTFLNDLALEDLRSPETAALETDRIRAIRARQIGVASASRLAASGTRSRRSWGWRARTKSSRSRSRRSSRSRCTNRQKRRSSGQKRCSSRTRRPRRDRHVGGHRGNRASPVRSTTVEESGVFDISEPIGDLSVESFGIDVRVGVYTARQPPAPSVPARTANTKCRRSRRPEPEGRGDAPSRADLVSSCARTAWQEKETDARTAPSRRERGRTAGRGTRAARRSHCLHVADHQARARAVEHAVISASGRAGARRMAGSAADGSRGRRSAGRRSAGSRSAGLGSAGRGFP